LISDLLTIIYFLPAVVIIVWYVRSRTRHERLSRHVVVESVKSGLIEPPTLHPEIDPRICIGCGACVAVCPEQDAHPVLGLIKNKAKLIGPSNCIGHGACKTACPVEAITLVFGTERRGIDIPVVKPNFETDVPGVFIAGELGGMGLIRNAIEQGRQTLESVNELVAPSHNNDLDVVIVGAGPAGFSASLAATEKNLRFVTVEQEMLGGTVAHYPRRKLVMTQPAELPIAGKMKFKEVSKEDLIEFWNNVEEVTGISINYNERVETIKPVAGGTGFDVKTSKRTYNTRSVLLAMGRMGTPRRLGVPGEDMPKVVYRLIDAEQYRNQHVLVVGGGDSALEAATSIAAEAGTRVTLSYRSPAFNRAKPKNRDKVEAMAGNGSLDIIFNSNVKQIHSDRVTIAIGDDIRDIQNDSVIVSAGGILPTAFLREVGITVETKRGTA
jgi:thioredoxin reductase (NADPH)